MTRKGPIMPPESAAPTRVKRGAKIAMLLVLPTLLWVLFVTAGTGQLATASRGMPASADQLRLVLDRVEEATTIISNELNARTAALDWAVPEEDPPPPANSTGPIVPEEERESVADRASRLTLEGVAWNAANPVAFVNHTVLTLDGEIDGLRVHQIRPDSVVFSDEQGQTHELRLGALSSFR